MRDVPLADEALVRRLPLPLAHLYLRVHNAKTPLERHLTAFYLWEAGLKLLASVAIVEYVQRGPVDAELTERLQNLARPALGHWWEFVRRLVAVLADQGDGDFQKVRDLVLGRTRDDMPRAAGLDAALRETLEGKSEARATVRFTELFDRLVRYRNNVLAHAAPGQLKDDFNERMARAILAGVAEMLGRLDVLAGRRLFYIAEVRQVAGTWLVQRYELIGESSRRLPSLELPRSEAAHLPDAERLYLDSSRGADPSVTSPRRHPVTPSSLHPLLLYDAEAEEVLFLNARRGRKRTEYLCYTSGRTADRPDLGSEQRELLARVLGMAVAPEQVEQWAVRSQGEDLPAEAPAEPQGRALGEFELLSELGRGGMGIVYRAWQPSLGRQVALKCLLRAGDVKAEARFQREIRALGRVEHPHLVKIFASGSDGDQWFYAMELVEGAPLSAVCDKLQTQGTSVTAVDLPAWQVALGTVYVEARQAEKPLSDRPESGEKAQAPAAPPPALAARADRSYVRHVVELMKQVAEAAHALHEAGIIHRDIKPGNIIVPAGGTEAVLMDLGLAQLADEAEGRLTRTRQFVGTLRYASPQQVLAVVKLDRRSDVYSLGATLWELLTLHPLFGATEQMPTPELMEKIQHEPPERLRKHHAGIAKDLEAIVLKCLEKEPKRRYPSALALAEDLQRFLDHRPTVARPAGVMDRLRMFALRNKGLVASVTLIFLALVGGIIGTTLGMLRAEDERDRARAAQRNAQTARDRARAAQRKEAAARLEATRLLVQSARLAMRQGAWRQGLDLLDRALQKGEPGSVALRLDKVRAWYALHEVARAGKEIETLARRKDLGDQKGRVRLWQADFLLGQSGVGRQAQGLDLVQRALAAKGLSPAEAAYAHGLLAKTTPDAVRHFRAAVDKDPLHQRANAMLALLLTLLGERAEARARLTVAESFFPQDPTFRLVRAELEALEGNRAAAKVALRRARRQLGSRQRAAARAWVELSGEVRQLGDLLAGNAQDPLPHILFRLVPAMRNTLATMGDWNAREGRFVLLLPLPPALTEAWRNLPPVLLKAVLGLGVDDALKELKKAVAKHPDGILYCAQGAMLIRENRWAEAEQAFAMAAGAPAVVPIRRAALYGAACCAWIGSGDGPPPKRPEMKRRAVRHIRDLLAVGTVSPDEAFELSVATLNMREIDLARQIVTHWERQAPKDPRLREQRFYLEFYSEEYGRAVQIANQALAGQATKREQWRGWRHAAVAQLRQSCWNVAVDMRDWPTVETDFLRLRQLVPNNAWVWHQQAWALLLRAAEQELLRQATASVAGAVQPAGPLAAAHTLRPRGADTAAFLRVYDEMERQFPHPKDAVIEILVRTRVLVPAGLDKTKAARLTALAKKNTDTYPKRADVRETYGAALYRAGRYKEAVEQLSQAVQLQGGAGSAWQQCFLAMAHSRLGHAVPAKQWLSQAVKQIEEAKSPGWQDRVQWDYLRREVEALVQSTKK